MHPFKVDDNPYLTISIFNDPEGEGFWKYW